MNAQHIIMGGVLMLLVSACLTPAQRLVFLPKPGEDAHQYNRDYGECSGEVSKRLRQWEQEEMDRMLAISRINPNANIGIREYIAEGARRRDAGMASCMRNKGYQVQVQEVWR